MKGDVVIIGAGVSGLATGALLAKAGKRVTILEKGNVIGGRANVREEKGFTLNYGPHGMYTPESGVLAEVMGRLGLEVPACGYPAVDRSYWAQGDRYGTISGNPAKLLTTALFSLGTRLRFAKLMLAVRGEKPASLAAERTWREWVASKTDDETLHAFMMSFATINTYTARAGDLSARWLLGHFQRTIFARDYVGYMHGGWRSMYDPWIEEIERGGGRIVTGSHVRRLETAGGRVTAAITEHERYEADAFVSTLPPQDAPSLADEGSPLAAELGRWAGLEEVRAYCIDLGFDRRVRSDLSLVYDVDRDLYLSIHSETAPDLAPAGSQLLHAMAYLTPEDASSESGRERRGAELRAGLDRHFPGWREAKAVERVIPNAKVLGARRTPENIRNLVPLRAATAANLYFANDARDIDRNLSQVCLAAALEVADAIVDAGATAERPAVAIA